ncbi:hypothetical protein [Ruegeria sp. PrR005]|uniref:Uncharacterized protein n=1 Tax=Ruegeria sp. PrR005 TaxID=2706882 RepID=A0A6B2P0B2_9RHOB|nr:hypothetical protein [Ruegeria sp. PrR005]NDW48099.1 hypothetical protein [Ruegeria sp. PrR005]
MTSFQIESTADAFFVRSVQALPDGGFAALLAGVGAAPAQLAVFGVAPDGSAPRIDADIILANGAISMVERDGGGFAVLSQINDSSPERGRTHATLFDASGNETDAFILPATIFLGSLDPQPNFSAIPGSPDLWLKGFDEAGFFLSRVDSDTLRPLDPPVLLRTDAPSFILDGGFGLVAPFSFSGTRGELIEATSFTAEDGLVPVYANPRNVDFSSSIHTAVGNSVVEVGITRERQSIAEGGNIRGNIQINLIEPDSGAIRTLTNDFLGFGFVEARVAEVPGLGFAVLVVIEGGPRGTSGIIDAAEVIFFDFDGNERESAVISDLVGQRTTASSGTFTFTALVDPLRQNLRFLTIWSPTDESGNILAARHDHHARADALRRTGRLLARGDRLRRLPRRSGDGRRDFRWRRTRYLARQWRGRCAGRRQRR